MTMAETIAEIRRQGGLVYVPHPFDRMHSVPDYEHLLDIVEEIDVARGLQPARRDHAPSTRRPCASRAKYRIVAGAGSDSHVAAGPRHACGSGCATSTGPQEFLESLRDADIIRKPTNLRLRPGAEVPADEGRRRRRGAARAGAARATACRAARRARA